MRFWDFFRFLNHHQMAENRLNSFFWRQNGHFLRIFGLFLSPKNDFEEKKGDLASFFGQKRIRNPGFFRISFRFSKKRSCSIFLFYLNILLNIHAKTFGFSYYNEKISDFLFSFLIYCSILNSFSIFRDLLVRFVKEMN